MSNTVMVFATLSLLCYISSHVHAEEPGDEQSDIIGGTYARISDYPIMAHLRIYYRNGKVIKCGSTIIKNIFLLTSAHCLNAYANLYYIRVAIGSSYPDSRGIKYFTKNHTIHPLYDENFYDYDLALVRTVSEMYLDGRVTKAVVLTNRTGHIPVDTVITVLGWGFIKENGIINYLSPLKVTQVAVVSMLWCKQIYRTRRISDRLFCATTMTVNKTDICNGDSGGPALNQDGVQIGVIKGGVYCGQTGVPSIYMNVGKLRKWIREVAGV